MYIKLIVMTIDGRDKMVESVMKELRELFISVEPLDLEVFLSKKDDVLKVITYAKMSGLTTEVIKPDSSYTVKITGMSCRCT